MAVSREFTRESFSPAAQVALELSNYIRRKRMEFAPKNSASRNPYEAGELNLREFYRIMDDAGLEALDLKRRVVPGRSRRDSWTRTKKLCQEINAALQQSPDFSPARLRRLDPDIESIRVVPHYQNWSDADIRRNHGITLLDAAEGDVRKISARWVSGGLVESYQRRHKRRFTPTETAAHLLHYDLKLIGYSDYLRMMAFKNRSRLASVIIRHWNPMLGPINYARFFGINNNPVRLSLNTLGARIEAKLNAIERGQISFAEAADDLNIGARGLRKIFEMRRSGTFRLWKRVLRSPIKPELRIDMLTLPELSRGLTNAVTELKGSGAIAGTDFSNLDETNSQEARSLVESLHAICSAKSYEKANALLSIAEDASRSFAKGYRIKFKKGKTVVTRPVERKSIERALALADQFVSELHARRTVKPRI